MPSRDASALSRRLRAGRPSNLPPYCPRFPEPSRFAAEIILAVVRWLPLLQGRHKWLWDESLFRKLKRDQGQRQLAALPRNRPQPRRRYLWVTKLAVRPAREPPEKLRHQDVAKNGSRHRPFLDRGRQRHLPMRPKPPLRARICQIEYCLYC